MPPKGKKKEVHNHPEVHPDVRRRIEQAEKAKEKKRKRTKKSFERWREQQMASASFDAGLSEFVVPEAESDLQANMNLQHSDCNEPGTSFTAGRQLSKQSDRSKTSQKIGSDHTSPQGKPKVQSNPKNKTSKKSKELAVELLNRLFDKDLSEGQQAGVKARAENKRIAEQEALERTKGGKSTTNTSRNISSIAHREMVKNLTMLKNVQQTFTQAMKSLKEEFAISGKIEVVSADKPKKGIFSFYDSDKREVRIGDEDIKITIRVFEGSQVVIKSRRHGEIDFVQTVKTCFPTMKGHVTSRPKCDIADRSEEGQKMTSDTKYSSIVGDSARRNSQTLDQEVDHPKVDTVNEQEKIEVEMKCLSSTTDTSEGKDSSSSNSEENMQKTCKDL